MHRFYSFLIALFVLASGPLLASPVQAAGPSIGVPTAACVKAGASYTIQLGVPSGTDHIAIGYTTVDSGTPTYGSNIAWSAGSPSTYTWTASSPATATEKLWLEAFPTSSNANPSVASSTSDFAVDVLPASPTLSASGQGVNSIDLSWNIPASGVCAVLGGFTVERASSNQQITVASVGPGVDHVLDSSLVPGTTYAYTLVTSYGDFGTTSSPVLNASTTAAPTPSPTPTATSTPTPVATPTPLATPTPVSLDSSPTSSPISDIGDSPLLTPTASPVATPTPAPVATPISSLARIEYLLGGIGAAFIILGGGLLAYWRYRTSKQ